MITWIKEHRWLVVVIGLLIAVIAVAAITSGNGHGEIVTVTYGDIQQTVAVTGRVEPPQEAELGFETTGTVGRINVAVGDRVLAGQTLLSLNNFDLAAALAAARESLAQAERGSRPEARNIVEAQTAETRVALETATTQLLTTLQDSYRRTDNALRNQVDRFFTINDTSAVLRIELSDYQLQIKTSHYRNLANQALAQWQSSLIGLTESTLGTALTTSKNSLQMVQLFSDVFTTGLNETRGEVVALDTTIHGVRSIVANARTDFDTALTNIIAAEKNYLQARSAFAVAEQKLALEKLGGDPAEILIQQARVREAEARLAKTVIRAPFTGRVAKQSASLGEVVAANTPLLSLISDGLFEIEANVPEAEIAKIVLGQTATVSLDAYPANLTFAAKVIQTDLTETLKDGVAAYGLRLQFNDLNPQLKSGLTANVVIEAGAKKHVLSLPARAIQKDRNRELVTQLKNNEVIKTEIVTGLRGDNGLVEIVSGLAEGDQVVVN